MADKAAEINPTLTKQAWSVMTGIMGTGLGLLNSKDIEMLVNKLSDPLRGGGVKEDFYMLHGETITNLRKPEMCKVLWAA